MSNTDDSVVWGWGCLIAIGLIVWGITALIGGESEGYVKYDDCRQTITLASNNWQKYYEKFTCTYQKTQSGKIMSGECVHIDNAGTLFSASNACVTAYVYEKTQDKVCTNSSNPYLGYNDMCYSQPQ